MDYKKLAVAIKLCGSTPKVDQCPQCPYWASGDMNNCIPRVTADAATAITDLLARTEAAEYELEQKKGYYDQMVDAFAAMDSSDLEATKTKLRIAEARAEAIEQDRDRLLEAMKPNCLMCDSMHENGNCTEVGGFCTAVPAAHCPLIPKLIARAEAAEEQLDRYKKSGLEPCDYAAIKSGLTNEEKAKKDEIDSELNETGLKGAFSVKELKSSDGTLWYYELLKGLNTYITYEDTGDPEYPAGHVYNVDEMEDLYQKQVDKKEYPDYDYWLSDMLKSGIFIKRD